MIFPKPYCDCSPNASHFFTEVSRGTGVWRCRYCQRVKWLPGGFDSCVNLSIQVRRHGLQKAYDKALAKMPKIKQILVALEEVRMSSLVTTSQISLLEGGRK